MINFSYTSDPRDTCRENVGQAFHFYWRLPKRLIIEEQGNVFEQINGIFYRTSRSSLFLFRL